MGLRDKQLERVKATLIAESEAQVSETKRLLAELDKIYAQRKTPITDEMKDERKRIETNMKTFQTKIDALKKGLTPNETTKRQGYVRRTI